MSDITDKYRLFELSLPFTRININRFMALLKMAKADCAGDDSVTLPALRSRFKTAAWKTLEDKESVLSKLLLSSAFKADGQEADQISV